MGVQVSHAALCQCTMGAAPAPLKVLPANKVLSGGLPAATVQDMVAFLNLSPFGTCKSLSNPITAALTAANLGKLTPGACIPFMSGPWAPGAPNVHIAGQKALDKTSTCTCAFAGKVSIQYPGQVTVLVP